MRKRFKFVTTCIVIACAIGAQSAQATLTASSTGVNGTITVQATDSAPTDVAITFYEASDFAEPGGQCNNANPCDELTPRAGTVISAGTNCFVHNSKVYCPDMVSLVGNFGEGDDSFIAQDPLEYTSMTLHGGGGNDAFTGILTQTTFADADNFFGDAGNDRLVGYPGDDVLHGGGGTDKIIGGAGTDAVFGDEDNDGVLIGGTGNDSVDGGGGDDVLGEPETVSAGPSDLGADSYAGGPGRDAVRYDHSGQGPVSVTIDGVANDGAGEGDNVQTDVEEVVGTDGADTVVGSAGNETLRAEGGNDTVDGGAGDDTLVGGLDDDAITGGPGIDSVFGDNSSCISLFGGCPGGNDRIELVDGQADTVTCGPGADTVNADSVDTVATDPLFGCETVNRVGAAPVPAPHPTGPLALTASKLGSVKDLIRGKLKITATCKKPCTVTAKVKLDKATAKKTGLKGTIGSGKKTLKKAGKAVITIRLTKKAKKKLAKVKTLTLKISVVAKYKKPAQSIKDSITVTI